MTGRILWHWCDLIRYVCMPVMTSIISTIIIIIMIRRSMIIFVSSSSLQEIIAAHRILISQTERQRSAYANKLIADCSDCSPLTLGADEDTRTGLGMFRNRTSLPSQLFRSADISYSRAFPMTTTQWVVASWQLLMLPLFLQRHESSR